MISFSHNIDRRGLIFELKWITISNNNSMCITFMKCIPQFQNFLRPWDLNVIFTTWLHANDVVLFTPYLSGAKCFGSKYSSRKLGNWHTVHYNCVHTVRRLLVPSLPFLTSPLCAKQVGWVQQHVMYGREGGVVCYGPGYIDQYIKLSPSNLCTMRALMASFLSTLINSWTAFLDISDGVR